MHVLKTIVMLLGYLLILFPLVVWISLSMQPLFVTMEIFVLLIFAMDLIPLVILASTVSTMILISKITSVHPMIPFVRQSNVQSINVYMKIVSALQELSVNFKSVMLQQMKLVKAFLLDVIQLIDAVFVVEMDSVAFLLISVIQKEQVLLSLLQWVYLLDWYLLFLLSFLFVIDLMLLIMLLQWKCKVLLQNHLAISLVSIILILLLTDPEFINNCILH